MARITGLTADRMTQIENESVISGSVDANGNLQLKQRDGSTINAGNVKGPPGNDGSDLVDQKEFLTTNDRPVYVRDFKEAGDIDDGASFRRAAAASKEVELGSGSYLVSPVTLNSGLRQCVPMSHGVVWRGAGSDSTKVKVAPNAGDYHAIFGPDTGETNFEASVQADLSGTSLSGFEIDQNATDNPVTSYDNQLKRISLYRGRVGFVMYKGRGGSVFNMRFRDFHSIWCVQILGQYAYRGNVWNCEFTDIGHPTINWDHTTIYLDCGEGGSIHNCQFRGRARAARQPYELHGSEMSSSGNKVWSYDYGMDATGSVHHGPGSGVNHHNEFYGVASGLDLWTGSNYGVNGQFGIDGLIFDHNLVEIDAQRFFPTDRFTGLVTLNQGATLPIRALTISNNIMKLTNVAEPRWLDQYSQAISMTRSVAANVVAETGNNYDRDIAVIGNTVEGAMAGFMRYTHPNAGMDGGRVLNNISRNVGAGGTTKYDGNANSALLMEMDTLRNFTHRGNEHFDTRPVRGLQRGAYYVVKNLDNVRDDGSRFKIAQTGVSFVVASAQVMTGSTGAVSMIGASAEKFVPGAHTGRFIAGSTMFEESTGLMYKKAVTGESAWVTV